MKKTLLVILLITFFSASFAIQNENKIEAEAEKSSIATLSGQVIDHENDEVLVGVKVTLEGTDLVTYTDFDGNYSFDNVKTGKYNVTASYTSYQKQSVKDVSVSQKTNQVTISLKTAK